MEGGRQGAASAACVTVGSIAVVKLYQEMSHEMDGLSALFSDNRERERERERERQRQKARWTPLTPGRRKTRRRQGCGCLRDMEEQVTAL